MKLFPMANMEVTPEYVNEEGYINPFRQDLQSMGTPLAKNITILHMNFPDQITDSFIIVNTKTGERCRLVL